MRGASGQGLSSKLTAPGKRLLDLSVARERCQGEPALAGQGDASSRPASRFEPDRCDVTDWVGEDQWALRMIDLAGPGVTGIQGHCHPFPRGTWAGSSSSAWTPNMPSPAGSEACSRRPRRHPGPAPCVRAPALTPQRPAWRGRMCHYSGHLHPTCQPRDPHQRLFGIEAPGHRGAAEGAGPGSGGRARRDPGDSPPGGYPSDRPSLILTSS